MGRVTALQHRRNPLNGVHDMGGMHGFGPIEREENEPVFHAEWEGHVLAMNRLLNMYNIDEFRYGIERMNPADYLRASYYERWLATVEYNLIKAGVVRPEELSERTALLRENPDAEQPRGGSMPETAPASVAGSGEHEAEITPRFSPGDAVIARNVHPTGHTRQPRYVRGKRGVVHRVLGVEIFPDTNAHGLGENPQPLYSVRFEARELWGESAEPRQVVYVDLWEPYLEPA
jgi:nitrile hydratase subunit beta